MQYGIEENILDNIIKIFHKFEKIKEVIIFGSRAKGNYRRGSDIELDKLYLP